MKKSDAMNLAAELAECKKKIRLSIKEVEKGSLSRNEKDEVLRCLYDSLDPRDVSSSQIYSFHKYSGKSLRSMVSHLVLMKKKLNKIGVSNLARGSNPKDLDKEYARELGVPVPRDIGVFSSLLELGELRNIIVKPYDGSGANGVFFVNQDGEVFSVKTGERYNSLHDAASSEAKNILDSKMSWIAEEAIVDSQGLLARDFKAYVFYGRVGLYFEGARPLRKESEGLKKCYYNGNGEHIYGNILGKDLSPMGVPEEARSYCEKISLSCPTPMLRVDFLRGRNGLFFGEITPHPGPMWFGKNEITKTLDKELGELYVEAEARIYKDLLQGKRFDLYNQIYSCGW